MGIEGKDLARESRINSLCCDCDCVVAGGNWGGFLGEKKKLAT